MALKPIHSEVTSLSIVFGSYDDFIIVRIRPDLISSLRYCTLQKTSLRLVPKRTRESKNNKGQRLLPLITLSLKLRNYFYSLFLSYCHFSISVHEKGTYFQKLPSRYEDEMIKSIVLCNRYHHLTYFIPVFLLRSIHISLNIL